MLRPFVEPHVSEEAFCCELSPGIEEVAFGYDDSAAVANQPCVGNDSTFSNGAQVIHFHLDRRKASIRLGSANYRKGNRSVDQSSDRAPVHYARELQVPLLNIEAKTRPPRLNRIEFDAQGSREVIGFELFTYQPQSFWSDFHSFYLSFRVFLFAVPVFLTLLLAAVVERAAILFARTALNLARADLCLGDHW